MAAIQDLKNAQEALGNRTRECADLETETQKAISLGHFNTRNAKQSLNCLVEAVDATGKDLSKSKDAKVAVIGNTITAESARAKIDLNENFEEGSRKLAEVKQKWAGNFIDGFFGLFGASQEAIETQQVKVENYTKAKVSVQHHVYNAQTKIADELKFLTPPSTGPTRVTNPILREQARVTREAMEKVLDNSKRKRTLDSNPFEKK